MSVRSVPPAPVNGACPACGKFVALALQAEPPQWACIDIDCVHGHGHPLPGASLPKNAKGVYGSPCRDSHPAPRPGGTMSTITAEQITKAVETVKAEIREHVGTGIIPADVADFSTLHSYLDANMLGGEDTDALWDDNADHDDPNVDPYAALNAMQTAVDQWIKDGGLRDADHPTCSHCGEAVITRRGLLVAVTDEEPYCDEGGTHTLA